MQGTGIELPTIKRVAFFMMHAETRQVLTLSLRQKISAQAEQQKKILRKAATLDSVPDEEWVIEYQDPRRNDLTQCWLFRYDCIVN